MADEIDLETIATQPAEVQTDEGTVKSHKLGDLVDAARFLGGKPATGVSMWGVNRNVAVSKGVRGE